METRDLVNTIYSELKRLNEILEETRETCPHKEHTVQDYMWRPGSIHKAKICTECDKNIGYVDRTTQGILTASDLTNKP